MDSQQQSEFAQHLDRASETVKGWPVWKQGVLGAEVKATPRLDQIRPRVLWALHVYGWGHFEPSQVNDMFTIHARLPMTEGALRGTLRFTEDGRATMEGRGGAQMVADLRAEMPRNPGLAEALRGVL